jgi:phosphoglycolate phosphatase
MATNNDGKPVKLQQIRDKQFQLALFDLDGTLIDSAPDLAAAVDYALTTIGLPAAGTAMVRSWVGNGAPVLIKRALAFVSNCSVEDLASEASILAYQHFLDYYRQHVVVNTKLYPGATELLQYWATAYPDLRMGIVTNKPGQFTGPICEQLNIAHFFEIMYSGDTFPVRKPDPTPLLNACAALGAAVEKTIMIGDSSNDLNAARAAGMTAVCVSYGYNHGGNIADHYPDVLVDSLLELM